MNNIKIQKRDGDTKLSALRADGYAPAIFYGPKEEATSIFVNTKDFIKLWRDAGESSIITLQGVGDDKEALLQDISVHPVSGDLVHVDFYVIERGKKVTVSVPFNFIGEAPAEKLNGNVVKVMYDAELEVKPSELPKSIDVDLTKLIELDSKITLSDLSIPESAEFLSEPEEVVAAIAEQKEEVEEAAPEETPEAEVPKEEETSE